MSFAETPRSGRSAESLRPTVVVGRDAASAELEPRDQQASYQALSTAAVVSVVFGVLSILTVLHWVWSIMPLVGIVAALWAWLRIARYPTELTGLKRAKTGLGLSLGLWVVGSSGYYLFVRSDVPTGYKLITFDQLQPDPDKPGQLISPQAVEWQEKGTRIFIRGYMYPGRQVTGIKEFVLVPTLGHCAFCMTKLKSTEMIRVELTGDLATRYKATMIGVGGLLEVDPAAAATPYGGYPYHLKADCIR